MINHRFTAPRTQGLKDSRISREFFHVLKGYCGCGTKLIIVIKGAQLITDGNEMVTDERPLPPETTTTTPLPTCRHSAREYCNCRVDPLAYQRQPFLRIQSKKKRI